jgi:iron complex outermembrane receptor protein
LRKTTISMFALVCAGLFPVGAAAQGAPAGGAEAADSADNGDIIVTAQRREERLQDVPASISAFSSDALETAGITNTQELEKVVPGLNFTRGNYAPQPTIRGIGLRGVAAGDESVVPIFIDGVYQPFFLGGFVELNNLERVEVLKGPQGALFGRNATGGAINLVTTTPTDEFRAKASVGYGRFDLFEAKGYISGGAGPVSGDLSATYSHDNGFVRNIRTGKRTGNRHDLNLRSKLRVEISDATEATLTYFHTDSFNATAANAPIDDNTIGRRPGVDGIYGTRPYETASNPVFVDARQDGLAFSLAIRGDAFDTHTILSYQNNRAQVSSDSDATSAIAAGFDLSYTSKSLYIENYASSNGGGPLKWLAGMVYFHDLSGFDPLVAFAKGGVSLCAFSRQWTDSYALYGQVDYDLVDALTLTVSGRYTIEDKKAQFDRLFPVSQPGRRYADSFKRFTPTATLSYRITPEAQAYLRYGQAFKSGLFNTATTSTAAVGPENVTSYEFGIKSDPLSWLRVNLAAYYTDYKDIQITARDAVTGVAYLQNAANARIYGLEGDIALRPSRALNLHAGFSWLKASFRSFPNAVVTVPATDDMGNPIGGNISVVRDASGRDLARMPQFMGRIGGDYSFGLAGGNVTFAANLNYQGANYEDVLNRLRRPPVWLADASIAWQPDSEAYRLTIWGKNLFDETYYSSITNSTAGDYGNYAPPLTFGARFDVKFR